MIFWLTYWCWFVILTIQRLPDSFFQSLNHTLASDIVLKVNGNYNWIVKCDIDRCLLTSTEEFLNTIVPHRYFPIVFKYVGINTFHVSVFDMCGLEIDYKKQCDTTSKSLYLSQSRSSNSRQKKPWFYNDTLLSTNKALAQYLVNSFAYGLNRIHFIIKGMHLYSNTEHVVCIPLISNLSFRCITIWFINLFWFNRSWNMNSFKAWRKHTLEGKYGLFLEI